MDLELNGRTAVVTGASKGIGLAVTRRLAEQGARVVAAARSTSTELDDVSDRFDVRFVAADLATAEGAQALADAAVSATGSVDVLVNNVGASEPASDTFGHDDAQWQRVFDVTFFSAVRLTRALVPRLADGGAIVNVASLNARLPSGMIAPYSAAKAALVNLSKAMAEDLAARGIRVNSVSPGPVRTPLWTAPGAFADTMAEQAGISAADVMDRMLPESMAISLGRVAEPEEIADLVAFLASARASWITGADYVIGGGMLKAVG